MADLKGRYRRAVPVFIMLVPVLTAGYLLGPLLLADWSLKAARDRITATDANTVVTDFAANCAAATWTAEERMELDFPEEVTLADTSWTVCFTSRGAADANVVVTLNHPRTGSKQVEVFTGGSARIVP